MPGNFKRIEPLTTRIRSILEQYPDGTQVLKELIQNADDARADRVCFVLDKNEYPKEKLYFPETKEFQGPALYAYNSSVFGEKDFESLQKLGNSTKAEDITKTGKFV